MPEKKELQHPVHALEDFGRRIRVFDVLGAALAGGGRDEPFKGEDLGVALIVPFEDWERCRGDVEAWFKQEGAR